MVRRRGREGIWVDDIPPCDHAGHRPRSGRVADQPSLGSSTTRRPRCPSPRTPGNGCRRSRSAWVSGPIHWRGACAAARRCSSGSSSGRSPTRSSRWRSKRCPPRHWPGATTWSWGAPTARPTRRSPCRAVLETRHCDAIVLLGDMRDEPKFLEDLRASQTPVVALWQGTALEGSPTVNIDNRAGMVAGLDHLLDLGHTRIAFIGGRPLGDIRERRTAFLDAPGSQGHPGSRRYVHERDQRPGGRRRGASSADEPRRRRPTAVICSTDQLAIGVLHAAAELGSRVPEDLSVVGFDDIPMAVHGAGPDDRPHANRRDDCSGRSARHGRRSEAPRTAEGHFVVEPQPGGADSRPARRRADERRDAELRRVAARRQHTSIAEAGLVLLAFGNASAGRPGARRVRHQAQRHPVRDSRPARHRRGRPSRTARSWRATTARPRTTPTHRAAVQRPRRTSVASSTPTPVRDRPGPRHGGRSPVSAPPTPTTSGARCR